MKYLSIIVVALALSSCAPATVTTKPGQAAYTADQIVLRLGELQNAVIAACAAGTGPTCTGSLTTATARTLVTFIDDATKTLHAAPQGWQTAILTAWQAAKAHPELQGPAVAGYVLAIDSLIGAR